MKECITRSILTYLPSWHLLASMNLVMSVEEHFIKVHLYTMKLSLMLDSHTCTSILLACLGNRGM